MDRISAGLVSEKRISSINILFEFLDLSPRLLSRDLMRRRCYAEGHPRWKAIDSSMAEFARIAKETETPFIVAVGTNRGLETEMVRAIGEREGFPVVVSKRERTSGK